MLGAPEALGEDFYSVTEGLWHKYGVMSRNLKEVSVFTQVGALKGNKQGHTGSAC
jgi:hypothetical protein